MVKYADNLMVKYADNPTSQVDVERMPEAGQP